jgi:hypothetical protein
MTHFRKFRIAADGNSVQVVGCDCEICNPIAPPYSIPAAAHEPPPSSINNATRAIWADGGTLAEYGFPKSSGIPATARAILNMVPERKVAPLTDKQQAAADGVGRAVRALTRRDDDRAFIGGAAQWHP